MSDTTKIEWTDATNPQQTEPQLRSLLEGVTEDNIHGEVNTRTRLPFDVDKVAEEIADDLRDSMFIKDWPRRMPTVERHIRAILNRAINGGEKP
jgi:hypothetical protein